MQLTANHKVATPADWKKGENVIILPAVKDDEAKKLFPDHEVKVLSIGTGINRRKINGKNSAKWGALNWLNHDILGIMLESSMFDEIASDLMGENYLRVNSSTGLVNRRMDDISEANLKRINLMGMEWWSDFGEETLEFLNV